MSVTLEMPESDTDLSTIPFDRDTALNTTVGTAETAADLLEQGEAEGDRRDNNPNYETHSPHEIESSEGLYRCTECGAAESELYDFTCDEYKAKTPPGDVTVVPDETAAESNGQPEKKKRAKKKSTDNKIELYADPAPAAAELNSPAVVAQLAKIETSRSTRALKIHETEQEYIAVTLEINAHEDAIDYAKAQIKTLSEHQKNIALKLRSLRNDDQWQTEFPLLDKPPAAAAEGSADPAGVVSPCSTAAGAEPVSTPPVPADFYPDAWRNASIDELDLPEKLKYKLIEDGRDTIGRLEDLRAEISQGRAKWPKGIGAAKITAIEDAVITWLTSNRDSQAFGEATQPAVPSDTATEPTADEADAALIARAAALNDGTPNCLENTMPTDKAWQSGYNQYGRVIDGIEQQLTDCPYIPGDEQDDWLRGFMAARADYPEATTTGETTVTSDLDEI